MTCEAKKPCFNCGVSKPEKDYGPAAWKARHADRRCCRDCVVKLRGYWSCAQCLERKPQAEFSAWQEGRDHSQNGTQLCNTCVNLALVYQIARRANQRLTPLRRREKRRRQQAIIDKVRKEIQKRTVQERTNAFTQEKQSCKERLPDCKQVACSLRLHCRGHQAGRTMPVAARRDDEERSRDVPVPVSILPGKCQQHSGEWTIQPCVCLREKVPCGWRPCDWPHSHARMPDLRNNCSLRKANGPNLCQAQKCCWTHMPPGKVDGDGTAALRTLQA